MGGISFSADNEPLPRKQAEPEGDILPIIPQSEWPKEDGYYWCLQNGLSSWRICELSGAGTKRAQLWLCGDESSSNEYVVAFGERVTRGA